jgi:tetratricopeptide (TPR) repeat protein
MRSLGVLVLALVLAPVICAQARSATTTPAQQKITWAEAAIKARPDHSQPYNDLAVACVYRVRETGDTSYYDRAEAAVDKSLELTPDNLEGEKAKLMIMLGRGEIAEALEFARRLNKQTPDDVLVYGFVAEAAGELGNYPEAEEAVQWMLNLRPGNVPAFLHGAVLRRVYGDPEGAMLFYSQAYQQMPPTQTGDQASTLTDMADLQLSVGHVDQAEDLLHSALQIFPGYYRALEVAARAQMARQHYSEAVELLNERNRNFPTAASRYALAVALERAGRKAEANSAYQDFESSARPTIDSADNANKELVYYYVAHGQNPAEALRIARIEIAKRHDVATLDAYAWALHANGDDQEAQIQVNKALAVGVRDAAIFYHAGMIAESLKDGAAASRLLNASIELNPSSESASAVREALEKLAPTSAQAHYSK